MDGFRRMLWIRRQHSADHIPVSALQFVTRGGLGPRAELRRTGFVIPSVTFCATAGLWSVDITFGSGLQIPTRVRAVGWAEPAKRINRGLGHFGGCRTHRVCNGQLKPDGRIVTRVVGPRHYAFFLAVFP